ncbi:hypothetical protein DSO57_1011865 [Entomophthora muscae]|uniref:Uncharacterized protein n=1 Tax=Entomophthora muscae TaxID=34485 RepID=A0ACC2S831_9FUNG|nr:hypothetical protein DSO57_1011865 [Entomophthora muscae]
MVSTRASARGAEHSLPREGSAPASEAGPQEVQPATDTCQFAEVSQTPIPHSPAKEDAETIPEYDCHSSQSNFEGIINQPMEEDTIPVPHHEAEKLPRARDPPQRAKENNRGRARPSASPPMELEPLPRSHSTASDHPTLLKTPTVSIHRWNWRSWKCKA